MGEQTELVVLDGKLLGHSNRVWSIAVTQGDKYLISSSSDMTVRLWNLGERYCIRIFEGHQDAVYSVALTQDEHRAVSASGDKTLMIWDLEGRELVSKIDGYDGVEDRSHTRPISSVAIGQDGRTVLTASFDSTLKLWDLPTKQCLKTLRGHAEGVFGARIIFNDRIGISCSSDCTLKRWDLRTGECLTTYRGHSEAVLCFEVTPDQRHLVSASGDKTIRLWDVDSGRCVASFEGHTLTIRGLAVSPDGKLVASASLDRTIRIWNLLSGACLAKIEGPSEFNSISFNPRGSHLFAGTDQGDISVFELDANAISQILNSGPEVRYTNAKVVLLGESGVGKSGLGHRLAESKWVKTDSTHGMQVWPLHLEASDSEMEKEVWLWDMAGQPEYRLVHQLFLEETALALVLFNPQAEDPFQGIEDWENGLRMAVGHDPTKLLIAARVDRGGATITQQKIERLCQDRGFAGYFATSAKLEDDPGCAGLRRALPKYIPWQRLPWISTTRLFKTLKEMLIRLKDEGVVIIRFSDLSARIRSSGNVDEFKDEELRTVIGLLAGQGLAKRLDFGDFILLQPEELNNYASAVIRAARDHVDGIGCIDEQIVLQANFDFKEMERLRKPDEEILLRAMVQTFIDQSLCIREDTPRGVQLVFPSQFNREIEITNHPTTVVSYYFSGHLQTIYTTLVVRLSYAGTFERKDLWKNAAEFLTPEGKTVGLIMRKATITQGEIKIFFESGVPDDTRVTFIKYVHEHLLKRANDVVRERDYSCSNAKCNEPVTDKKAIRHRLNANRPDITCQHCDTRIPLIDLIERKFREDRFLRRVQALDSKAKINLDNESRELILVGHTYAIAGEAGQIFRQYTNSDHGIDGEIEFKNASNQASGKKVYLQLKSGDSYLYERRKDGKEVFTVQRERHLEYWQSQAYPVYLVIRTSDGNIRWMNVTEYLKNALIAERRDTDLENPKGKSESIKQPRQIIFRGEQFTPSNLLKLRNLILVN